MVVKNGGADRKDYCDHQHREEQSKKNPDEFRQDQ